MAGDLGMLSPTVAALAGDAFTIDDVEKQREATRTGSAFILGIRKIERLEAVLNDPTSDNPQLRRLFLAERNASWARWIRERMARPGTVFIAVGAGHLAGHDSVQTLLAQQGIRAERVPHQGD